MLRTCLLVLGFSVTCQTAEAQKAGVGAWEDSSYRMIEWIEDVPGLGWYYNWRPDQMWSPARRPREVEFVPMIHSAGDMSKRIVSDRRVTALMGFNEPDGKGAHQANLTVDEAIALWPKVEARARGLRLGSPATTAQGTLGRNSWQRRFMNEVEARGLRVDFMAVHYYSRDGDVDAFRRWLEAVHRDYRRPIWVTEFARIDWDRPGAVSHEQNAAFATAAIRMMERLPFVERHAWFAATPYPWKGRAPRISLLDDTLRPTPVGNAFRRSLALASGLRVAAAE